MLKAMFQNENRIKYSAKFISYFIDVDYEVILNNIKLGNNEIDKEKEFDRALRCDYIANLDDTILNIEVNNNSSPEVLERNMKYAHRLFSKKVKTEDNNYKYSQVIQINLNNFFYLLLILCIFSIQDILVLVYQLFDIFLFVLLSTDFHQKSISFFYISASSISCGFLPRLSTPRRPSSYSLFHLLTVPHPLIPYLLFKYEIVAPFLNSLTILTFSSKVHFLCLPMKKYLQSSF